MRVDSFRKVRIAMFVSDPRCRKLGDHLGAIGAKALWAATSEAALAAIEGQETLLVVDRTSWLRMHAGQLQTLLEARRGGALRVLLLSDEGASSPTPSLGAAAVDQVLAASVSANELTATVSRLVLDLVRSAPKTTKGPESARTGRARVLVVDDSEVLNRMTSAILMRGGYQVTCVTNPFETYACLARESPDIALVDYNMPLLRGDVVIDVVKRGGLRTPMVLYSNAPEPVLQKAAAQSGAVGYILKGSPAEVILDRVAQLLREHGVPRSAP
jgi:CheY-like chemotaxis protein